MPNEAKDYEAIVHKINRIVALSGQQAMAIEDILRAHFPPQPESAQGESILDRAAKATGIVAKVRALWNSESAQGEERRREALAKTVEDTKTNPSSDIPGSCADIADFAIKMAAQTKDLDPRISSIIDANFDKLIDPTPSAPSEPGGEELVYSGTSPRAALCSRAPQPEPGKDDFDGGGAAYHVGFEDGVASCSNKALARTNERLRAELSRLRSRAPQSTPAQDAREQEVKYLRVELARYRGFPAEDARELVDYIRAGVYGLDASSSQESDWTYTRSKNEAAAEIERFAEARLAARPADTTLREALEDLLSFEYRRGVSCQKNAIALEAAAFGIPVRRCLCRECIEKRARAVLAASPEPSRCDWKYDGRDDDYWMTSCGLEWCMEAGTPQENGYVFCPRCGKPINYIEPEPEEDEDASPDPKEESK
jgi:hypothetical protein